jgi:ABC-type spermidine/putrescine transport system permease subunit II
MTPLRIYTWALIVALYVPIGLMVALSFNNSKLPYVWGGFTLRWYEALFGTPISVGDAVDFGFDAKDVYFVEE